jgi:hypothetical protein
MLLTGLAFAPMMVVERHVVSVHDQPIITCLVWLIPSAFVRRSRTVYVEEGTDYDTAVAYFALASNQQSSPHNLHSSFEVLYDADDPDDADAGAAVAIVGDDVTDRGPVAGSCGP